MHILGYDIGSSSVKAAIVEAESGKVVACDFFPKTEAPIKALKAGWAEQNPENWWEYLRNATSSVLRQSNVNPSDIKAIGISYQMHGLVAVDHDLRPLRDAIIWCDSRAVPFGERAFKQIGEEKCLGHLLNSPGNFTAGKLAWVRENEPEVFNNIYKVMLPGEWVAAKMTGEICTTVEGLSEWMLWDFAADAPASFLLDYYGIPQSFLPRIRPTFSEQGRLTAGAAADLGLAPGTPVTYRAGDQPNNALSLGVLNPGEIASTAGTSGVVYGINDKISYDSFSRVNNFAHVNHSAEAPRIGVLTCISGTGILNSWIRRNVAPEGVSYAQMNDIAAKAPVGCEGLSALPFGNGAERILCNQDPGCSFHGINFNIHSREHFLRAAQEGIVFSFMYGIEIMQQMGLPVKTIHAGMANMFLSPVFRQTLSSVSGATIKLYDTDGAAGAARGAGIGAGIYGSATEAFSTLKQVGIQEPADEREAYLEAYQVWKSRL